MDQKTKNTRLLTFSALGLALTFGVIFYFFSAKVAAWVVLAIIAALLCVFLYPIVQLLLATRALFRSADGFMSALRLEIQIAPLKARPRTVKPGLAEVVEQFRALGFVPAGFYNYGVKGGSTVYAEGLAHPGQKVYAQVSDGGVYPPYGEVASFYADGGSYTVSGSQVDEIHARPANMVHDRVADLAPAELLARLLQDRPAQGLLETPPEGLLAVLEGELRRLREHMEIMAAKAEEEEGRDKDDDFNF